MTDARFVWKLVDSCELLLHLAKQLERWRQIGDLLALDELLDLPERIVGLIEIRQRLAGPRQVIEGTLLPGHTDLRFDPGLPACLRGLALGHGPAIS